MASGKFRGRVRRSGETSGILEIFKLKRGFVFRALLAATQSTSRQLQLIPLSCLAEKKFCNIVFPSFFRGLLLKTGLTFLKKKWSRANLWLRNSENQAFLEGY